MFETINAVITNLNSIARVFCGYAAGLFVQSSVMILFVMMLDFVLRRRVRAVLRYCVWMLVFVKLVLPTSFAFPTGIGYWLGDYVTAWSAAREESPRSLNPAEVKAAPTEVAATEPALTKASRVEPSSLSAADASHRLEPARPKFERIAWQSLVFLGWLIGVLVLTVLLLCRARFVRQLLEQSEQPDQKLRCLLSRCRELVGVRANVGLKVSTRLTSPAVCGLFRPTILLPEYIVNKLSNDKLTLVLMHELAHIRRRDVWVNLIQSVLQIVYFYNPIVWVANIRVRRVREQAVDEMVLVVLGGKRESYSNTLIDVGEMSFGRPNLSLRLIGIVESKKDLAERIRHIVTRPTPNNAKPGLVGLLAVAIMGALLLPMVRAEKQADALPATGQAPNKPYDHFLFFQGRDSLMMAKVLPDRFELKELDAAVRSDSTNFLCVIHGKFYCVSLGVLKAIDIESSQVHEIAHIDAYFYDDYRLYTRRDNDWFVYDLREQASCKGMPFPGPAYHLAPMNRRVAFSPDKKRLAYFIYKAEAGVQLKVVNTITGQVTEPCPPFVYHESPAGWADALARFRFVWLDSENILYFRTENLGKWANALNHLVKTNVVTGETKDVAPFPAPGFCTAELLLPALESEPVLIVDSGPGKGRYRVDVEQGRIIKGDTRLGEFRLSAGGYFTALELHRPDSIHHGDKQIAGPAIAAVSPDGKRIIWTVYGRPRNRAEARRQAQLGYYDSAEQVVRTISGAEPPLLWFRESDLEARQEPEGIPRS